MTGAGDYFSSGNDLSNFLKADPSNMAAGLASAKGMQRLLAILSHVKDGLAKKRMECIG